MKTKIDMSRYLQPSADALIESKVTVEVPKGAFQIAPKGVEAALDFFIINIDRRWYLVDSELAKNQFISTLTRAKLYPAIRHEDGSLFLIPVTYPFPSYPNSWFNGWQDIIKLARKQWLKIESKSALGKHVHQTVPGLASPEWPDFDYYDLLQRGFGDHTIATMGGLRKTLSDSKSTRKVIVEEEV